jgi:hypothetical protein
MPGQLGSVVLHSLTEPRNPTLLHRSHHYATSTTEIKSTIKNMLYKNIKKYASMRGLYRLHHNYLGASFRTQ